MRTLAQLTRLALLCALPLAGGAASEAGELEQIKVTVHKVERRPMAVRIVYTVQNGSARRINMLKVACSLYGPEGNPAGAETSYVNNVAPNEEVVGEAAVFRNDVATAKCRPADAIFARP